MSTGSGLSQSVPHPPARPPDRSQTDRSQTVGSLRSHRREVGLVRQDSTTGAPRSGYVLVNVQVGVTAILAEVPVAPETTNTKLTKEVVSLLDSSFTFD